MLISTTSVTKLDTRFLYVEQGNLKLENSNFTELTLQNFDEQRAAEGGLAIKASSSNLEIEKCRFENVTSPSV